MSEPHIGRHSLLRDLNHSAVLESVAQANDRSRVEIAGELTLSQASVSRIVDKLIAGGLVRELPARQKSHGRPQVPLAIRAEAAHVVTVDIRRACYRLRLTDLGGGNLAEVRTSAVDPHTGRGPASAEDAVELVNGLLLSARRLSRVRSPLGAVAVGVSAAWDERSGRVYAARNVPYLEGVDLRELVSAKVGVEATIDNDVKLAAVGEFADGSAEGRPDFYYLSLGSGVAGAAVLSGKVQRGRAGFAGELGYLRVRTAGGGWTDLETLIGRGALEGRWRGIAGGEPLALGLARVPSGPAERAFRAELIAHVTLALTAVATVVDVPLVVLGGSLGVMLTPLLGDLAEALSDAVPPPPALLTSRVGTDAALIGGIRIAQEAARAALLRAVLD